MTLSGVRVAFTPSAKTKACLHAGSSPSRIGLVWASLRPCGRRTTLVIGPASSSPGSGGGQNGGLRVECMVSYATRVERPDDSGPATTLGAKRKNSVRQWSARTELPLPGRRPHSRRQRRCPVRGSCLRSPRRGPLVRLYEGAAKMMAAGWSDAGSAKADRDRFLAKKRFGLSACD